MTLASSAPETRQNTFSFYVKTQLQPYRTCPTVPWILYHHCIISWMDLDSWTCLTWFASPSSWR